MDEAVRAVEPFLSCFRIAERINALTIRKSFGGGDALYGHV
jgi:hypothetical protein